MAQAITDVLRNPEQAAHRATEGKRIAQEHAWEKRMERILSAVS
jgi:hypothetical protein